MLVKVKGLNIETEMSLFTVFLSLTTVKVIKIYGENKLTVW